MKMICKYLKDVNNTQKRILGEVAELEAIPSEWKAAGHVASEDENTHTAP